jgi:protein-S-isoprenylcysteine O-methyltransferase Ste14
MSIPTLSVILLAWFSWCLVHSLLISKIATDFFQKYLGNRYKIFRLAYVLFSVITLIPLLFLNFQLDEKILFIWKGWWRIPQLLFLYYALHLFVLGSQVYDMRYFLGIRQIQDFFMDRDSKKNAFSSHGILAHVRHPWYGGGLVFLWALGPLGEYSIPVKLLLSFYLLIGSWFEEKKLIAEFGETYRQYIQKVPMFFPWQNLHCSPRQIWRKKPGSISEKDTLS